LKRRLSSGIVWTQNINVINYIRFIIKKENTANNQKIFPGRKKAGRVLRHLETTYIEGLWFYSDERRTGDSP